MTPLVLLPGSLCNARLFAKQLVHFSNAIVMDYGSGNSIELMALDILKQAPPKFSLAGLSMGGIVALEIMRIAPERVERLALMNTNYKAEVAERIAKRSEEMQAIKTRQLNINMMLQIRYYPDYFTKDNCQNKFELETVTAMAYECGQSVMFNQWEAINNRRDYSATLKNINCPVLVLTGEQDTICPPKQHREIYQLLANNSKKTQLEIIPNCAHLSTLESPVVINNLIQQWLTYD